MNPLSLSNFYSRLMPGKNIFAGVFSFYVFIFSLSMSSPTIAPSGFLFFYFLCSIVSLLPTLPPWRRTMMPWTMMLVFALPQRAHMCVFGPNYFGAPKGLGAWKGRSGKHWHRRRRYVRRSVRGGALPVGRTMGATVDEMGWGPQVE